MTEQSTRSDAELTSRASIPSEERPSSSTSVGRWDIAAAVCANLGLLLWIVLPFLLDPLDHSEQLANSIAAFVNLIGLAVQGGFGTILLGLGCWLISKSPRLRSSPVHSTMAARFAWFAIGGGVLTALIVLGLYAPVTFSHLR